MRLFIAAAASALLLAGCGDDSGNQSATPQGKAIPAPNNGSWTETVEATAEGGFRMGNPNAPVKLVEYGSLGCHVCAEFSEQGSAALQEKYVRTGRVSWEFRPYQLFPTDPGVSMLLRCRGPGPFFQLADQLYAEQAQWMGRIQAGAQTMEAQLQSMPAQQRGPVYVQLGGLDEFFRVRGMPQSQIDSCLANSAEFQELFEITKRGNEEGVQGTPTFFINGRVTEAHNWKTLEPLLRQAGG